MIPFTDCLDSSELQPCLTIGLKRVHAGANVLICLQRKMLLHLFVQPVTA
jgi:hypothetical protein